MKILSEDEEGSQKNIKIVSIVGFGGLGKTTLAKALYDKVSKKYKCRDFVPVGQNQGVKKVLSDILFELDKELYKAAERLDERQLINQLQEVLAGNRYFLVIDDIWDIQTWEIIKCAFVDSQPESKIIVTTRIFDVATRAGSIYHMKPLSDYNSKLLFYTRTCGDEEATRDNQPDEVTKKILHKCGGVPLAIITIASLLVGKTSADWSKVYDGIGFGDEDREVIKNTRKILSFSYYDLQPYLKTCLLYLGMYPEDKFIEKKTLIWRWVSEGFAPDKQGIGSYELGERYYNDLVNKSLIREIKSDDDEEGCRVHDMVLDLIRTMSMEVNFVIVEDRRENQITSSPSGQGNRVHRLAFHGAKVKNNPSIKMENVRSFGAITCTDSGIPPLSTFKVLRVLVIDECSFLECHSLEHLGKLVQLRYLGLVKTAVKLPEGIGHELKFLEILDVRGGLISELPPSVAEIQKLRCLWADEGTRMKGEIGKLVCLEELQLYSVEMCPNFFTELGKLTNLRVLKIHMDKHEETTGEGLTESLYHLHKVEIMEIMSSEHTEIMDLYKREPHVRGGSLEDMAPSSRLRICHLKGIVIPRMPSWVDSLCVWLLSHLWLHLEVIKDRDLQSIGRLPSLLFLVLVSEDEKCISYTFGSDEFKKLKVLGTNIEITLGEGSLPSLEVLGYSASSGRKDSLVPWNNSCLLLNEVECLLDCAKSSCKEVKAAKAVLRKAQRAHPNAKDLCLHITTHNYTRNTSRVIDALSSLLDGADGEEITADQRELRARITKFKSLANNSDAMERDDDAENTDRNDDGSDDDYPRTNIM